MRLFEHSDSGGLAILKNLNTVFLLLKPSCNVAKRIYSIHSTIESLICNIQLLFSLGRRIKTITSSRKWGDVLMHIMSLRIIRILTILAFFNPSLLLAADEELPPGANSIKKELKDLWFKGEE